MGEKSKMVNSVEEYSWYQLGRMFEFCFLAVADWLNKQDWAAKVAQNLYCFVVFVSSGIIGWKYCYLQFQWSVEGAIAFGFLALIVLKIANHSGGNIVMPGPMYYLAVNCLNLEAEISNGLSIIYSFIALVLMLLSLLLPLPWGIACLIIGIIALTLASVFQTIEEPC